MTTDTVYRKHSTKDVLVSLVGCSLLLLLLTPPTSGHGRLLVPASRQSAWRFGFKTPVNYDDHGRNCGGRENQWDFNKGRCGLCGDPAQGPLWYERPDGIMVQHDVITSNYTQGQTIDVTVEMTVNHWGWFEFRICDVATTGGVEATQECLDKTLLADASGETRFEVLTDEIGYYFYHLILPDNMVCQHCMIQWKWKCGNSPGYGEQQEEFYACSDVRISPRDGSPPTPAPTQSPTQAPTRPAPTDAPTEAPTDAPTPLPTTTTTKSPTTTTTRSTTTPTTTTTPKVPPKVDNDVILDYFQNQATKRPSHRNPGQSPPPRPKHPARPGVPDMGTDALNTLCLTCQGTGCRFAGCHRLCPNVCF